MSFFSHYHSTVIHTTYKPSLLFLLLFISKYQPKEPRRNYIYGIQYYLSSVPTLLRIKCMFQMSHMENYTFSNPHMTRHVVKRLAHRHEDQQLLYLFLGQISASPPTHLLGALSRGSFPAYFLTT